VLDCDGECGDEELNIESVPAGQNGLVNVGLVITMVRIQTVCQDGQAEKQ